MYDNEYNRDITRRLRTIDMNYINSDLAGRGMCGGESNYKKGGARLGNPQLIGYPKGTYLQGSQMPSGAYGTNAYGMLGRGQVAVVSEPNDTLQRQNTDIIGANSAGLSRRLMQRYNGAGTVLPVVQSLTPYQSAIRHQIYDVRRPPSNLTPVAQLQPQYGGGRAGAGFLEDFGDGFKKGFFGTLGLMQPVLPYLGNEGKVLNEVINVGRKLAGAGVNVDRPDFGIDLRTGAGRSAGAKLNTGGRPRLSKAKRAEKKACQLCGSGMCNCGCCGSGRSAGAKLNTGGRPRLSKAKKAEKKALEMCMNKKSGSGLAEDFYKGLKMPYEYAYKNVVKPIYKEIVEPVLPAIKQELINKLREKAQNAIRGLGRSAGAKLNTGGRPRLSKAKKAEKMALKSCMSGKGKNARAEIVKGVMKDKGMSMIEASSYVKANNLY